MGIDWKRKTEDSRSRSWIYGLLATVFRKEPTPALVSELRAPELSEALNNMEVELGEGFFSAPEAMVAEALAEEFTRLFSGPGRHVSSHESFFAEIDGD
jgi:TorA maturation chaperone TorD